MENIRQAVDRAISEHAHGLDPRKLAETSIVPPPSPAPLPTRQAAAKYHQAALDDAHLQANRIIAQDATSVLTRSFDMLRTQVLQQMDAHKWKIVAVTSPTPGCGKTVTGLNLGMSISRMLERQVLLLDLDFARPSVAKSTGLTISSTVGDVLEGSRPLEDVIVNASIGRQELKIVTCAPTTGSAELMASRNMASLFQQLRREYGSHTIIVDLPPILTSDDVITALPYVDCVLLVCAVGISTVAEIEESKRHLQNSEVVRVVLNKVPESSTNFYPSYYGGKPPRY
jgi:protein-tyrosine kinase